MRWSAEATRQTISNDDLQMLNHSSPVRCIIVTLPTPIQLVNVVMELHVVLDRHFAVVPVAVNQPHKTCLKHTSHATSSSINDYPVVIEDKRVLGFQIPDSGTTGIATPVNK
jgi:hypothetical protein